MGDSRSLERNLGLPTIDASHHMVLLAILGLGKTTIARKLGQIYKNLELSRVGMSLKQIDQVLSQATGSDGTKDKSRP